MLKFEVGQVWYNIRTRGEIIGMTDNSLMLQGIDGFTQDNWNQTYEISEFEDKIQKYEIKLDIEATKKNKFTKELESI